MLTFEKKVCRGLLLGLLLVILITTVFMWARWSGKQLAHDLVRTHVERGCIRTEILPNKYVRQKPFDYSYRVVRVLRIEGCEVRIQISTELLGLGIPLLANEEVVVEVWTNK